MQTSEAFASHPHVSSRVPSCIHLHTIGAHWSRINVWYTILFGLLCSQSSHRQLEHLFSSPPSPRFQSFIRQVPARH